MIDQDAVALLARLVALETPTGESAASAAIADLLTEEWRASGARVQQRPVPSGVCLIADLPGVGTAPVVLLGHSDTVWPRGTIESSMPWRVDGDIIRGPGVLDMKGGLVVISLVLRRLAGQAHPPVRVVLSCDEEVGSPASGPVLAEACQGAAAVLAFECPHPDGAMKSGRRGSTRVLIEAFGRESHAALDPKAGVSAIDELIDQLSVVRSIITDVVATEVLCNVGRLEAPGRANVVAGHAEAELGLRFLDPDSENAVLTRIAALAPHRAGARVTSRVLSHRPAWAATAADRDLADRVIGAARRAGGALAARPAAGAGDANNLAAQGYAVVDGLGPCGAGAHAPDEWMSLASLVERVNTVESLLVDGWLRTESQPIIG